MNPLKTLTVAALAVAALAATAVPSQALGRFLGHGPVISGGHFGHFGPGRITCFACNLPRPHGPVWGHGPRWPHYGHWRYWYRWHPVYFGGGAPVGPASAPAAAMPGPAAAAPQAPTGACNCLTKQDLPNGGVLFQDVCTQQSAIAPPQNVSAR
jgi:hypothetical protein